MNKINKNHLNWLLNFLIETLLITNLWIIVYNGLLDYLNFAHPPKTPHLVLNINPIPNPEPFDIPLYFILTFLALGIVIVYQLFLRKFLYNSLSKKYSNLIIGLKVVFFVNLLLIFLSKIGSFPLAHDPFPYKILTNKSIYGIFFLIFIITVCFFTFQLTITSKVLKKKIAIPLIYGILAILVSLITFDPQFYVQAHDARYFYGPVWEIVHGKTIFTDIPSQYGFLSVLFFSLVQKITHINFIYLSLIIWVMFIAEYLVIFYLIYKTSKSLLLALIGFFSLVATNYFAIYHLPQAMSLRWLPLFLALFLVARSHRIDSKKFLLLLPFLALWNIDSGLALIFAYMSTIGILFLLQRISLKEIIKITIYLLSSSLAIMLVLNGIHIFLGMHTIDFLHMYETLRKNASTGFLMMPMESQTYFWFFILLYFASIIYVFRNLPLAESEDTRFVPFGSPEGRVPTGAKKRGIELSLLVFSTNLMFFASIYYVGRSVPHNLFILSPFFITTLFLLIGNVFQYLNSTPMKLLIVTILFVFLIIIPAYYKKEYFTSDLVNKYKLAKGGIFRSWLNDNLNKRFNKEAELIKKNITEKETLILSPDESYLFYMVDKKNLLDANPQVALAESLEIDKAIGPVGKICPDKIALDCKIHNKCPSYTSFTDGWYYVIPSILDALEKKCKVKYRSTICTNQLCIAEKNTQ